MAELTKAKREILTALNNCTAPWWPVSSRNKSMLTRIEKKGWAARSHGYPVGWIITTAGRAALASATDAEGE